MAAMRPIHPRLFIFPVLLLLIFSVIAQSNETIPFTTDDGTVTFLYPRAWTVADRGGGLISLAGSDFSAALYTPAALTDFADVADPARLALNFVVNRGYVPGELTIFVSNSRPAARQDYTGSEVPAGFVLVFPLDNGRLVVFDATTSGDSRILQRDLEILMTTFRFSEAAVPPDPYLTFASADGALVFQYPRTWQVIDNGDGTLRIESADFSATLFTSPTLADSGVDDPARLVSTRLEASGLTPGQFSVFLSSRRPAARFDYTAADGTTGFLLGFTLADGTLLLLDVIPVSDSLNTAVMQKDLEILVASIGGEGITVAAATAGPGSGTAAPVMTEFVSSDGTLTLTYPDTWFFGQDETGKIYGFLGEPAVSLTIFPPELLVKQRYLMNGEAPEVFLARYRSNFGLQMGAIETLTLGELPAARRDVTLESGGQFIAIQVPGGAYVMAEGFMFSGEFTPAAERAVTDVLKTLTYSGAVIAQDIVELPTPTLEQYADGPDKAVVELENLGLIPFGGRLLTEETYLFFRGAGEIPVRFNSLVASQNLVLAGQITYTTSQTDPGDYCGLSVRRALEAGGRGKLTFGLTSDGLVFYTDEPRTTGSPVRTESTRLDGQLSDTHTFLVILIDDRLTLYVDGQPVFVEVEVEERTGVYALVTRSTARGAACEGRNLWVYALPDVLETGVCEIQTAGVVNKRSGPGTNFRVVDELPGFSSVPVIGQTTGEDGFRWWHLEDDTWVRGDIVRVAGDCSQFLEGTPEATPEATEENK